MKQPQQSFYIYSCALGHYNLAAPAYYDDALMLSANMAVVANMAFCVELLLKCSDSKITQGERHPDGPIMPATIGSNAWGHDLVVVFDDLNSVVSSRLAEIFEQETGQPIRPLLLKCKDYFNLARYYYSSKQPGYDISGIKLLADGLLTALHKGYGAPPPPSMSPLNS